MKVEKYEIPDELWYTKNHEWISVSKDKCTIGITDYAQESLHDIVYVELPKVGAKFKRGDTLGTVESVKAVADVFAPVNCEVFQVNTKLSDTPELLNKQPYQDGWIAIVGVINLDAEKNDLLNAPSYADYLRSQIHK